MICPYCSLPFEHSDKLAFHLLNSTTCPARHSRSAVPQPKSLATSAWFQWGYRESLYRIADLNGRPALEWWTCEKWIPLAMPPEADALIFGIAKLADRLSRAETRILSGPKSPTGNDFVDLVLREVRER